MSEGGHKVKRKKKGADLSPGWGTMIPHVAGHGLKKKSKEEKSRKNKGLISISTQ